MPSPYITDPLTPALFIERPNRFIVFAQDDTERRRTYIANPGKLQEILLPEVTTLLLAHQPHTKTQWECVGASWQQRWQDDPPRAVFLNTGRVNDVAEAYLARGLIPGLEEAKILRREVTVGDSRFDFLLNTPDGEFLLEVKSVSLVEHGLALFPDAVSRRATKHVEELTHLASSNTNAAILFIVQGQADNFLPDVHNDLDFARALRAASTLLPIFAIAVPPTLDDHNRLHFPRDVQPLPIPWESLDPLLVDAGLYLAIFEVNAPTSLTIDARGTFEFAPGFYTYIGSAKDNLTRQMNRHTRKRKGKTLHVDYLRDVTSSPRTFAIRGTQNVSLLSRQLAELGHLSPDGLGLLFTATDPVLLPEFQRILTSWRHRLSADVPATA